MNKKCVIAIILLLATAITFCGLWICEKNDRSDMETLRQFNAAQALADFERYKESQSEGEYWYRL